MTGGPLAGPESVASPSDRDDSILVGGDASARVGAYVIDSALVTVGSLALLTILGVIHGPVLEFQSSGDFTDRFRVDSVRFGIDTAAVALWGGIYFAGSWVRSGATIGQRASGLQVLPSDGAAVLTVGRAVVRYLALGVPLWLAAGFASGNLRLVFWCLGVVWYGVLLASVVKRPSTVGIHDRVARTIVVRRVRPLRPLDQLHANPHPA